MTKKTLTKVSTDGKHYALKPFGDNSYVIWEYSGVTGDEAEHSKKIATFDSHEKATEYWNKIK